MIQWKNLQGCELSLVSCFVGLRCDFTSNRIHLSNLSQKSLIYIVFLTFAWMQPRYVRTRNFMSRLKEAAARAVANRDLWAKHKNDKIPAERMIWHMYQPEMQTWKQDETIVKMEREPFTNGSMRYCYRMKKRSPPPQSASNHRFHDYDWTWASNYVAKAYHDKNGDILTSDRAKENVWNDILQQYEASHWSERFNNHDPPKKIIFIRAYAIKFPDRKGSPWFTVERYNFGNGDLHVMLTLILRMPCNKLILPHDVIITLCY